MSREELQAVMYQSILELASERGITASGREEAFGGVFGRDSAITVLQLLNTYRHSTDPRLMEISERALLSLIKLQGRRQNAESGAEPGKFIHEFRWERYDHLTHQDPPWYIARDRTLRNYDSIDATPLGLIAIYRYWRAAGDDDFLLQALPAVQSGLRWMLRYADRDGDDLIEFDIPAARKSGGLVIHSWTDSREAYARPDGTLPPYPIAPVEVQGFGWLALKLWADFFRDRAPALSRRLDTKASRMKIAFNERFILTDQGLSFAAQALDGNKEQIKTITGNPLLCLWATHITAENIRECIIDDKYIPDFVRRGFRRDLFHPAAGIRTMSTKAETFNPRHDSYHNGSFWPMLNGLIYEGLLEHGYLGEAVLLREATLKAIDHFGCAIELFHKHRGGYREYRSESGQTSCKKQAWSAAAILRMLIEEKVT